MTTYTTADPPMSYTINGTSGPFAVKVERPDDPERRDVTVTLVFQPAGAIIIKQTGWFPVSCPNETPPRELTRTFTMLAGELNATLSRFRFGADRALTYAQLEEIQP